MQNPREFSKGIINVIEKIQSIYLVKVLQMLLKKSELFIYEKFFFFL